MYNELGPGFLESVYLETLGLTFHETGLAVEREMPVAVRFRGRTVGRFRADMIAS